MDFSEKNVTRFFNKVEKTDSCWLWRGAVSSNTYGIVKRQNKSIYVHRWSYAYFKGPIPDGFVIDHLCRIHTCVNPNHLEAVSIGENVMRGVSIVAMKRGRTNCPNGHLYTKENTHIYRGYRVCRLCKAQSTAKWLKENKGRKWGEDHQPRSTRCKNGHQFDKIFYRKNGYAQQVCFTCQRERSKQFRLRVKTKA